MVEPSSLEIGKACVQRLLRDPTWVIRRKDAVELISESFLRHRTSVDFELPEDLKIAAENGGGPETYGPQTYLVPIGLIRKARARFTRFDIYDEGNRSIPLPTRHENVRVSVATLVACAAETYARHVPKGESAEIPNWLANELADLASAQPRQAIRIVKERWLQRPKWSFVRFASHKRRSSRRWPPTEKGPRGVLARDPDFFWLLRTLTYSSIVLLRVQGLPGDRRILKLSYEEHTRDLTISRWWNVFERLGGWLYRLGWRAYQVDLIIPYAGAQSYHFEFFAPEGTEILEADTSAPRLDAQIGRSKRVHFYLPHGGTVRSLAAYFRLNVEGPGFPGSAVLTALAVAGLTTLAFHRATDLATYNASAAPSLLMLFPALIATYLARPEHPLVSRLLSLARWMLLGVAVVAYLAAARLAVRPDDVQAATDQIEEFFGVAAPVGCGLAAGLILTRLLPLSRYKLLCRIRRRVAQRSGRGFERITASESGD